MLPNNSVNKISISTRTDSLNQDKLYKRNHTAHLAENDIYRVYYYHADK